MLTLAERARCTVVLVGARNPQNIGAAARAMQDFGFSDLRIANSYAPPFEAAQLADAQPAADAPHPKSAVGAATVMAQARRFDDLAKAIADCTLVAGTTAIGGRELQQQIQSLQQATPQILSGLRVEASPASNVGTQTQPRVALLFGSEKTGLTKQQLSHCSLLLTIPMFAPLTPDGEPARHLSMNLGQSVAVCLYELTREGFEGSRELPEAHLASATTADRERLTQLLLDVMHVTGYTRRFPAHSRETVVRRLAQQLGTTHDEATTWMGLLRQVLRREPAE